ncbi:MAG: hypothetical protein ACTIDN_01120 [Acetobacter sp.]|uniref:hypothetical protein n=1 Tax=Acetobacter sp. TaxID=440 RepID=UPI003F90543B
MSDKADDIQHKLEDGVGRLQDGADKLFDKADTATDDFVSGVKSCTALDAVRDTIVDQPLLAVGVAGAASFLLGAVLKRKL